MNAAPKILVVGAAGTFAGLVVPALAALGHRPRAFVRSPEQARKALSNGAEEIAMGDLRDEASVEESLKGVNRAFYISPVFQADEIQMGVGFVEAAKRAGVSRIVFSTIIHPSLELRNHATKRPIENAVYSSGMGFTMLRPAVLYQNMSASWPTVTNTGVLAEPFSVLARIARVDYRDVAEVAALALTEDRLLYGDFELSADSGTSRVELAATASEASGRSIRAEAPDFEEWAAAIDLPYHADQREQLAAMYAYYDRHGLRGSPFTLRAILGREPRSLKTFFADLVTGKPTTNQ